jgi:acetyl-CoA C-acetyltransferase
MATSDELPVPVFITGWGHSRFGKLEGQSLESFIVEVASAATLRAGVEPRDIDAIYLGTFNSGLVPLAFASSLALQMSDDLFGVPATRVENACASGSAAVHQAVHLIASGLARHVLVLGAEKMSHAPATQVGAALLGGDYDAAGKESAAGFAGLFAQVALAYEQRYGPVSDILGVIAAKSHANAMANPYAHLHKKLSVEFCQAVSPANPLVAPPLRRTDCSPVSDGAAAIMLSGSPSAGSGAPPVRVTGIGHANDFAPAAKRDPLAFAATGLAWSRAMKMAHISLQDLSLAELHDCFTIAELNLYEVLGITARGEGRRALEEGWVYRDGRLPVNPSGGLKAKGHPVGATGVSQHALCAMQLTGAAGDMQLNRASRAAVHNMGGLAVANYVTILEAVA